MSDTHDYSMDYSALERGWATQGAADWCAEHGHAYRIVDGVQWNQCPRCLEAVKVDLPEGMTLADTAPVAISAIACDDCAQPSTRTDIRGGYYYCNSCAVGHGLTPVETETETTFTLKIKLGNDAMQTGLDLADAINEVTDRLQDVMGDIAPGESGTIRDVNGNTVGKWEVN